jgi:RNA polymerase primary sigma factor
VLFSSPEEFPQSQIDYGPDSASDSLPSDSGINAGDSLGVYLREIREIPLLTAEEETALFQQIESGVERARHALIAANLRLVVSICRRYANYGMDFLDLIQEGNIGLIAAVKAFDWRRGHRFSSFAAPTVRGFITNALTNRAHTIRIPKYARQNMDLALREPLSLETLIGEDSDVTLGDSIVDENAMSPFESAASRALSARIAEALNSLPPKEAQVLRMRYGLDDGGPGRTLEVVAEGIGVGRERVRQIEAKALRRLRHPRRSIRLRTFHSQPRNLYKELSNDVA